jgi:hypothetical protein
VGVANQKKFGIIVEKKEKNMKTYYIYDNENDFYLGMILAKDWVDARSLWSKENNVSFGSIYACATKL